MACSACKPPCALLSYLSQYLLSLRARAKQPGPTPGTASTCMQARARLQILALFAMECPVSLEAEDMRNEKVKLLRNMREVQMDDMVTGQYRAATTADGKELPGAIYCACSAFWAALAAVHVCVCCVLYVTKAPAATRH